MHGGRTAIGLPIDQNRRISVGNGESYGVIGVKRAHAGDGANQINDAGISATAYFIERSGGDVRVSRLAADHVAYRCGFGG